MQIQVVTVIISTTLGIVIRHICGYCLQSIAKCKNTLQHFRYCLLSLVVAYSAGQSHANLDVTRIPRGALLEKYFFFAVMARKQHNVDVIHEIRTITAATGTTVNLVLDASTLAYQTVIREVLDCSFLLQLLRLNYYIFISIVCFYSEKILVAVVVVLLEAYVNFNP